MSKLLSANFARLKKDKVFWLGIIFMFGLGTYIVLNHYYSAVEYGISYSLNSSFFGHAPTVIVLIPVFCSLFIGTEYSDGTIRNKLIVGHTRNAVYFSNLIVSIAVALLMCLSYTVAVSAIGTPLLGFITIDLYEGFFIALGCVVMTIAVCSLCTMMSMLNQNRTVVAIVTIIGVAALFVLVINAQQLLEAPEFYEGYQFIDGEMVFNTSPNPNYLTGTERVIYEYVFDILPTGQALQFANMAVAHFWQLPLYSLAIAVISTLAGFFGFRKKDIK